MSEEVKKEGEFSLKGKTVKKPKDLGKASESMTKVEIPNTAKEAQGEVDPEVIKVQIDKKEEDAVQEQSADASNDTVGQPEDSGDSEKVVEEVRTSDSNVESPLT